MISIKGTSDLIESMNKSRKDLIGKEVDHYKLIKDIKKANFNKTQESKEMSKMLTICSNFARSKTISFRGIYIHFNNNGVGQVPDHYREIIEKEMAVRPGRYTLVEEQEFVEVSQTPEVDTEVESSVSSLELDIALALLDDDPSEVSNEEDENPKPPAKRAYKKRKK